jgi:hypothetical protein
MAHNRTIPRIQPQYTQIVTPLHISVLACKNANTLQESKVEFPNKYTAGGVRPRLAFSNAREYPEDKDPTRSHLEEIKQ